MKATYMNKHSSLFEYTQNQDAKKQAFTIAEVLIAMMIMVFALMAISPVITKRMAKSLPHRGSWECYIGEDGKHYSKLTKDGVAEAAVSNYADKCVFSPQPGIDEYFVTAIGGGGGGASGTSAEYSAVSYGEPVQFFIEKTEKYDVLLIGGGGSGSARPSIGGNHRDGSVSTRRSWGGWGGSAGKIKLDTISLTYGYYLLKAGQGGIAGGLDKTDVEKISYCAMKSEPSSEDVSKYPKVCNGENGEDSVLYKIESDSEKTEKKRARGGYGAGIKFNTVIKNRDGNNNPKSANDDYDTECTSRMGGSQGGKIHAKCNADAAKLLGLSDSQYTFIGGGGAGSTTSIARPGYNGVALVSSAKFYSGGGGKSGNVVFSVVKDIYDDTVVVIGQGGQGGQKQSTNGFSGENSSFGFYVTAKGGNGGEIKAKSGISDSTDKLEGEVGFDSPFQGKTYGAGGNGGYAYSKKASLTNSSDYWGKGEQGKSGYVIVEWN